MLALLLVGMLPAQNSNEGALRGQVSDASGAAVADATVELSNAGSGFRRETSTDAAGRYSFTNLPLTGQYALRVAHAGFAEKEVAAIGLRAGENAAFDFTLSPAAGRSDVTVYGTVEGVRADSPQLGTRVDDLKLENTPFSGRKLTSVPLLNSAVRPARGTGDLFIGSTLFVINAGGRRQTSYVMDGGTADDAWGRQTITTTIPLAAVQEINVLTNSFSPEYGRTTGGVVNVNTRAGTNQMHGDVLGLWRPSGIQARSPLSDLRTSDQLEQFSGQISGPVIHDRLYYSVAGEYNNQSRDSTITSPLARGNYRGNIDQALFLARMDYRMNNANSLFLRANFDRLDDSNPADAVGGLNLPSAARFFRRATYTAQMGETAVIASNLTNEARLQFYVGSPITQFSPVTPSTQYVRPGVGTQGDSRIADLQNHQWQLSDVVSWVRGPHNLRMGGDVIYSSSGGIGQEFGGGYTLGQFTLKPGVLTPIPQLTPADVQRYTQSFGNQNYNVKQWMSSIFVQDNWRVRRNLTIDMGIRYERQTFTDDPWMWSPRVGFAYSLPGNRATVIRGGYGIYYSQLRANLAAGWSIGGPQGIFSYSVAPGQYGFPSDMVAPIPVFPPGAVLPARDITVRPGEAQYYSQFFDISKLTRYPSRLLNPMTQQSTFGIERELFARWTLSLDFVDQRTSQLERPLDLNAPSLFVRTEAGQTRTAAAADATRPIVPVPNGYRRITGIINDGIVRYDALQVNLNKRFGDRFSLLASYTYSHAINSVEPDIPQQDPNDANWLGKIERATSLLDQRQRAVLSGWWSLPRNWSLGPAIFLAASRPFNALTGVDNNSDGNVSDRPVVNGGLYGRNVGQGTPFYDVQIFVQKDFVFSERYRLSLRAEAFNLFNHANIVGRNGTWGNGNQPLPTYGQPLGGISNVDPGRQFQFFGRFSF
jgi:hypothetical protein